MIQWEAERSTQPCQRAPGEEHRSSRKCNFKRTTSRAPGSQTALQQTDRRGRKLRPRVLSGLLISQPQGTQSATWRLPGAPGHLSPGPGQLSYERRIRKSSQSHCQKRERDVNIERIHSESPGSPAWDHLSNQASPRPEPRQQFLVLKGGFPLSAKCIVHEISSAADPCISPTNIFR